MTTPALAQLDLNSGTGCTGCGIPPERIASAQHLIDQIAAIPKNELNLRLVLGEICTAPAFNCGTLSEDEARRVVESAQASNAAWWDTRIKIGLKTKGAQFHDRDN